MCTNIGLITKSRYAFYLNIDTVPQNLILRRIHVVTTAVKSSNNDAETAHNGIKVRGSHIPLF